MEGSPVLHQPVVLTTSGIIPHYQHAMVKLATAAIAVVVNSARVELE